ncbi:MAG: hypothetical protein WBG86_08600 [Polyangiales bacterium]
MRKRFRTVLVVAAIFAVAAGGLALRPRLAHADHTYNTRLLDSTAYSLDKREFRLGLAKWSYGVIKRLQISTYTLPWILGAAFEKVAPNLEFKSTLYRRRRLALSLSFEFAEGGVESTQLNEGELETTTVNYLVFVTGLASSVRVNSRISTHLGGQFTGIDVVGDSNPADADVRGVAVVNMLQIWGMFEWRVSPVVALTLTTRWLPYVSDQVVRANLEIDDNTGAIIGVEVEVFDLKNGFAVIPGAVFSWNRTNIRIGVGYGDFFVESIGLVIPRSFVNNISAEFDVFVRF